MKEQEIQLIPIEKIRILNPRLRNQKKFQEIVRSIHGQSLKKPITVSRRREEPDCTDYDLVCGQGRLEAYMALGAKEIPAIVIDVSREDRLLMSLVENLARKISNQVELMENIKILKERGYTAAEIGSKTGLSTDYVYGILHLLEQGEERLIIAVTNRQIPLYVALEIAKAQKSDLQQMLMQAYESKELTGKEVQEARRLMQQRDVFGKGLYSGRPRSKDRQPANMGALRNAYKEAVQKQRHMLKKAELCETQLIFIVEGLKELCKNESFINLLRDEQLETMPPYLSEQIQGEGEKVVNG